jgi:hypothetical protein
MIRPGGDLALRLGGGSRVARGAGHDDDFTRRYPAWGPGGRGAGEASRGSMKQCPSLLLGSVLRTCSKVPRRMEMSARGKGNRK